jgi:hypothetical protein
MKRKGKPFIMAGLYEKTQREKDIEAGIVFKYYFLREINTLPEISLNDSSFAEKVFNEYDKLPFDDLCWLIRDIRYGIQRYKADYEAGMLSMNSNFWEKLCANGLEFKSISITSNKGTIELTAGHPIFEHYFYPQFKKIKLLQRDILESQSKGQKFYMVNLPFNNIWRFLNTTQLGEFQKRVITGMFLVYFNLYKDKPLMTEKEWNKDPTYAATYKHYLSDTVKGWLKST